MIIEIKHGNQRGVHGVIRTDPAVWLREKKSVRDFRKILKLSQESDRAHGTDTVEAWACALRDEQEILHREEEERAAKFNSACESVRKEYEAKLEAALDKLREKHRSTY